MDLCRIQGGSRILICWGLTCHGLVSCPGEVKDSLPLNIAETGDKSRCYEPFGSAKDLVLLLHNTLTKMIERPL